jgi:hypothetical protein
MKNLAILILIGVVILMILFRSRSEKFSTSGLSLSDLECLKYTDIYIDPKNNNQEARDDYRRRVCGKQRRQTVDSRTGNYWMENGTLV